MKIVKTEMVPWKVECECPNCRKGHLEFAFMSRGATSGDREHAHKCPKCSHEVWLAERFPRTEFRPRVTE